MAGDFEQTLRGPQAYKITRKAIDMMERHNIWPTPLNFELWLHVTGDSQGDLAAEIDRLLAAGSSITEEVSEELATRYLPKQRLNEEIRDTGDQLSRELSSVSDAIRMAKQNHEVFGRTRMRAELVLSAQAQRRLRTLNASVALEALDWAMEQARKRRDLVLFMQLQPLPGGQPCLYGGRNRD